MNLQRTFRIAIPDNFSFKECLWFLDRDYDDCLHTVTGDSIVKAIVIDKKTILIRIRAAERSLIVELLNGTEGIRRHQQIGEYVRNWFDLERDLEPFYRLLQKEPGLAYMTEAYQGLRLISIPDLFEALCWGIIGQQINLSFAYRLKRRLTEYFGKQVVHEGISHFIFPSSADLAGAEIQMLRDMQYSQKKAEYLIGLAQAFETGTVSRDIVLQLSSFTAQQQALTALRGIGIWTANYALMKSLHVAEAIPYGDVGLLQALVNHQLIENRKDEAGIDRIFRKFKGWESYLVFYLWRSLAEPDSM